MRSVAARNGAARHLRAVGVLSCVAVLVGGAPAVADVRTAAREDAALDLLERAVRAGRTVGYTGTQYVASWSAGASTSTLADVAHDPNGGVVVTTTAGAAPGAGPAVVAPTRLDRQLLAVLAEQYDLVVAGDESCTGRPATVVEARRPGVAGAGAVAGRLWLDHDSGLLLRREVYDDSGRRVRSSAFVDLSITAGTAASAFRLAPRAVTAGERAMRVAGIVARADVDSGLARLRRHGWQAPERLPRGFVLFDVRLRDGADGRDGEPALAHLSYSDGLSTVSLFAQRGRLGSGPAGGFELVSLQGAPVWRLDASPSRAVWSGAGQVWTLVSDAPPEVVEATVLALPHDPPPDDGLLPRLGRGLSRLARALNPFS